jgi:preprotein translocase subunit SecD
MTSLRHLLQDADPLRHEASRLDAERDRIRRTVLGRAPVGGVRDIPRRRFQLAIAGVVLAAVASVFWAHGRSPVFAAVRFEVRLAEEQPAPGLVVAEGPDSRLVYLHPDAVVNNDDIAISWVAADGDGRPAIHVEFLASGAEKMRRSTARHIDRPIAVLIDGRVVMAPTVRSPISGSAIISGNFTPTEAERIAEGISAR